MEIKLSPWQSEVWDDKHRYKVINCGRRAGKSYLVSVAMLEFAMKRPKSILWMISPSYKQSKLIMWAMLGDLIPTSYIDSKNETELSIRLINGSTIVLKGADNPDSLRGVHIDFCVFDETAFIKKWDFVWNVVRPTLIDSKADCWFISTPNGLNHFKDLYDTEHPDWKSFHYTTYDNPYLDPVEINEARTKMSEEQFAQEFLGEFMQMAGIFFREFKRETHVINPFVPTKGSTIVGGLDWGYLDPFCISFDEVSKVVFNGVEFYRTRTFLEMYESGKTQKEWAVDIKNKLKFFNLTLDDIGWIRADTQLFNKLSDSHTKSMASLFYDVDERYRGLLKPADKDRIAGWGIFRNWLSIAPDGLPYYQITSNCNNGIRELQGAYRDDNIVEDISSECAAHFLDQQRYKLRSIKWIDAKIGGITHKQDVKQLPTLVVTPSGKIETIDINKFR